MNAHDAIVQAVLNLLRAAPALADGQIFEEELRALPETALEAIVVDLGPSTPLQEATTCGPTDWMTTVAVECYSRRDRRDPLVGRASRRLHGQVYARLMADRTLGGTVFQVMKPEIDPKQAQLNTDMGCCVGLYRVSHRTAEGSLDAA